MTQSTEIQTEYLMTLHSPGAGPPQRVDSTLTIYHSSEGWAKGPKIVGTILAPTGDWLRATASGSLRVDARMTLRTDDGALIYVSYGGVISMTQANFERMSGGATLTSADVYFVTTPVFQTSAERYGWLNHVQAIGKVASVKGGAGSHVRYDVFAVK